MVDNVYRRWVCVTTSQGNRTCELIQTVEATTGFLTKGECQQNCITYDSEGNVSNSTGHDPQFNLDMGWSCNIYTGECEEWYGGIYKSKEDCMWNGCHASNGSPLASTLVRVPAVYGWACDDNSGSCIKVLGGPYPSKESCESECTWNGGPSTSSRLGGYWRWFCSNEGCKYVRTSKNHEGFTTYLKCKANCAAQGKDTDIIIINVDNIRNMGSVESTGKDSYTTNRIEGGADFYEDTTMPESFYTELEQLLNLDSYLHIDFKYYHDLSEFFATYAYPIAIVGKLDFMKYILESITSESSTTLKLPALAFARELKKFITPLNQPNYVSLNIGNLNSFWDNYISHHTLTPPEPLEPVSRDSKGNSILQGPIDIEPVVSNLLKDPGIAEYRDLNPATLVTKKVSGDYNVENTKMKVELAFNKLPGLWRNGLKTISTTRPIATQPFIPASFDNIQGVVPYYGTNKLMSNRVIYGDLNGTKVHLHQKVSFLVPEDSYATRSVVKYVKYAIDFRTDLNVSSSTTHTVNNILSLENGEQGLVLLEDGKPLNVTFKPSNSIVMSVVRRAKPPIKRG